MRGGGRHLERSGTVTEERMKEKMTGNRKK